MKLNEKQIVFTAVVTHLRKQGRRATAPEGGSCRYRANKTPEDPCRCAIGSIIEDPFYFPGMEGKGLEDEGVRYSVKISLKHLFGIEGDFKVEDGAITGPEGSDDLIFLNALQAAHDNKTEAERLGEKALRTVWEERFAEIAKKHELVVPPFPPEVDSRLAQA